MVAPGLPETCENLPGSRASLTTRSRLKGGFCRVDPFERDRPTPSILLLGGSRAARFRGRWLALQVRLGLHVADHLVFHLLELLRVRRLERNGTFLRATATEDGEADNQSKGLQQAAHRYDLRGEKGAKRPRHGTEQAGPGAA